MDLNIPALDLEVEEAGKWFTYRGGIRVKVARINNDKYMAGATEMYQMLDEDAADTTPEQQASFMATLYARYLLKDWEGVVDVSTKEPVPYTADTGVIVLGNPAYKDLLAFILRKARAVNEYWEDKTEETGEE